MVKRHTVQDIQNMKANGEKIAMLTAYDATFAKHLDSAGADLLLVGDSLGMVIQGQSSTLPVTMDHMVYHTQAVVRGSQQALVVADLPFMSYQAGLERALLNAGRLMAEGGAGCVKLEGGKRVVETTRAMVEAGIPVMGHIGLTPQSVHAFSGFKVQGREESAASQLLEDALLLEEAGAFAIVLETIPQELAKAISEKLRIPTIGIGAGPDCDGQVLVSYDMLGLFDDFKPKFVKRFAELAKDTQSAVADYVKEVKDGTFPSSKHSFK